MTTDIILEALLMPLSEDAPCGPSLRYDPVFMEVRLEREEDDPDLPMGEWERPLKRADWALIESRCKGLLVERSKDLQIAAWLLEAWLRRDQLPGVLRGLRLVRLLLERFWDSVHPLIGEDDDADARFASLEWLNQFLSIALRVHVSLVEGGETLPFRMTLLEWERMTVAERAPPPPRVAGERPKTPDFSRSVVKARAAEIHAQVAALRDIARSCVLELRDLDRLLKARRPADAPSLAHAAKTLEEIERLLTQLAPDRGSDAQRPIEEDADMPDHGEVRGSDAVAVNLPTGDGWQNRDQAYLALESIADYLASIEPHSPTPYLVRRAVNWGRMSLPEVMAEVVREEGDLNRMINLLGLQPR